jgi:hypothetical protein
MRFPILLCLAVAVLCPACSSSPPTSPTQATAALRLRVPAQVAVRTCAPCGNGDLEVAVDLIVEETAGVGGTVTAVDVVLRTGSTVLAGPVQYSAASVTTLAGGTARVPARGTLTLRDVAMHFAAVMRAQLPATYSLQVTFRDDNGHTVMEQVTVHATP